MTAPKRFHCGGTFWWGYCAPPKERIENPCGGCSIQILRLIQVNTWGDLCRFITFDQYQFAELQRTLPIQGYSG
jgi:hypothetical protein